MSENVLEKIQEYVRSTNHELEKMKNLGLLSAEAVHKMEQNTRKAQDEFALKQMSISLKAKALTLEGR